MMAQKKLAQAKKPLWKKTMLQRVGLDDIREDLEEISEAGDYYGYEDESLGEYYDEYRPCSMSFPPAPMICLKPSSGCRSSMVIPLQAGMILPWR